MNRLATRTGENMKAAMAAVLVVLMAIPLAAMPVVADDTRPSERVERYVPSVQVGDTTRWEGGRYVQVRVGDVTLTVLWSENASVPAGVRMVIDYRRFFGAAELYDEQGAYLRTIGLPLHTVLMQEFDSMVEFRDTDNDTLFDFRGIEGRMNFTGDAPAKVLSLRTAWHLDGQVEQAVEDGAAWVNFTLAAELLPYGRVYDDVARTWRPATTADGALDAIRLTFHLAASAHQVTAEVPFYRITLADGDELTPTRSEFLENRTVTGTSVAIDGKYDQRIEGWDFAYADSKLALLTPIGFGNFYSRPIVHWLQEQFGGACLRDGTFHHCESDAGPTDPVRIARDRLRVAEGWQRAGDVYWVSDVTVDGQPSTMTFEIYHATPLSANRGDRVYTGFRAFGGFVYPQGQVIEHDPGLAADALIAALPEPTNVAPSLLVGLQLAVAAIALVPALLLRRRGRKGPSAAEVANPNEVGNQTP
jgi:hypothetical protein